MSVVAARVLGALNARDIDAFVACYGPDATIEDDPIVRERLIG